MRDTLVLDHLVRMTTDVGLFEHALLDEPRVEHGMCVDDVARALVVTSRMPNPSAEVSRLISTYLDFVVAALHDDGTMHNRRNPDGTWADATSTDDHWGRAVWALGTAASSSTDPVVVHAAAEAAQRAMRARTRWPRAAAYAALGASLLIRADHATSEAWATLTRARALLPAPHRDPSWPWPEVSLTYANAVLPEAMVVVGRALDDDKLLLDGVTLLRWLVAEQEVDGRISVVPAHGRRRGDVTPGFDQQPIEVACLAEAARTASEITGDPSWAGVVEKCRRWFEGDNDAGVPVRDAATGAGYDGLHSDSVNLNRGAESTLAWLSTQQLDLLVRQGSRT